MQRLACVSFLLVVVAVSPALGQTRVDVRATHVLVLGGRAAVLAADLSAARPLDTRRAVYTADLPVVSAATLLAGFSSGGPHAVQNGSLHTMAGNGTVRSSRAFANVAFTELTFPAISAAVSGSGDRVTARFVAEATEPAPAPPQIDPRAPSAWRAGDFRITVGTLPCTRISKVSAITIRVAPPSPSASPDMGRQAIAANQISNLVVTLPASDSGPWAEWLQRTVVEGRSEPAAATIEYLSADRQRALFTLELGHLEVVNLRAEPRVNNQDSEARHVVELRIGSVQVR